LTQATAAVGGLSLQFRHHERLFLSENFAQERLWMLRGDAPRLQMLWPEVALIKRNNGRRLTVDCGRYNVAILSSFVIRGISWS